jgi:hypothetical protein
MFDPKALRGLGGAARIPVGIALCWGLCAPVIAQRPTGGLVAHDPLDGSLEDVTDNACAEVATGSPAYAAGVSGQALAFDGVDDAPRFARLSNSVFAGDFSAAWSMNAQSLASETCDFFFVKARVDGEPDSGVYGDRPQVGKTHGGRSIMMRVHSFAPADPAKAQAAQAGAAFEVWRNAKDPLHEQAELRGFERGSLQPGASAEM